MASRFAGLRAQYRHGVDEVTRELAARGPVDDPVTVHDLEGLPAPVGTWLRRCGIVGRPRVAGFTAQVHGRIRSGPDAPWMPFTGEQVNLFGPEPTRLFSLTATRGGLPVRVLHEYRDGRARMRARLCSVVPVLDASGPAMTRAETVTVFNDLCVMAPGALLDAPVSWSPVDERTARGTYRVGPQTVTAELAFDAWGDLVDFVSDDRLRASADGRTFTPQRWSTPLRRHRELDGARIPTEGEGRWHAPPPEGTFPYIEFCIDAIAYARSGLPEREPARG
jgi:hypothetical protein